MRDISSYLEAFKEKKLRQKEREKQRQSQRKKVKRLDEYKAIDKALQQEKKEKANQIVRWHQQWLQTVLKQPIQPSYETDVGDFNEEKLYSSWEEIEADTSGRLNPNYREFIQRTRHFCCFFD